MNFDPLDPTAFDLLGIFCVFFVGLSVFLGIYGLRALILGRWSLGWPTVAGRILDAWTESRSSGYRGTRYRVRRVRYEYEVGGQVHEGSAIRPTDWYDCGANFAQLLERYPRGARVKVSYNPKASAEAFLEPGVSPSTLRCFVLSVLFFGVASFLYRMHP